jgi:soluble lytic murein transglycosylase-like protein
MIFGEGRNRRRPRRRLRAASVVTVLGLGLLTGTVYAGAPAARAPWAGASLTEGTALRDLPDVNELTERATRLTSAWSDLDAYYEAEVAPLARVLVRYRDDEALARRVAVALVREAKAVGIEPRLLLAVLLVENPWLDPRIRSPVGAIGLMQVMPVHRGGWAECGDDLESIDQNICHGARIFAHYFERSGGDIERALLRYNGCVRGTNTPNCHQYPYHVFARAGRASVLAWLGRRPVAASP